MYDNHYSGKFVVFEGLDGSGQTTQCQLLIKYFEGRGLPAVLTKEPTDESPAGKKIFRVLSREESVEPARLQELFAEDRKYHLENFVIPHLEKGEIVLSDRYFFSSFAYGSLDSKLDWLIDLNKNFMIPDITFLLKVDPKICAARIQKRGGEKSLFEREEILEKVWRSYEKLPQKFKNFFIVNGERHIDEVFDEIKMLVEQFLLNE